MAREPATRRSSSRRSPGLVVSVVDASGRPLACGGLGRWLARVVPQRVTGTVTIALVSDARARHLNRTYRRQDYPTDVLSFGAGSTAAHASQPSRAHALGDIVIATGVARRQARAARHSEPTELRILALHGLLHLIGYDHEHPADAGAMARIERQWRRRGGLPEGLIDRAAR